MAVRRESVVLSLDDAGFSTGMAKAAAAAALLDRSLGDLDGSSVAAQRTMPGVTRESDRLSESVKRTTRNAKEYTLEMAVADERASRLRKTLRDQAREMLDVEAGTRSLADSVDGLGASTRRTDSDLNRYTGRLGLLLRAAAILGPTLAPISTVAVAGVGGLASQFGFAATGALSLVVAAQGVGDALKAVNEAALEPTAANLEKAREAMSRIGPEAREFVTRFQELRPVLGDIRDAAARGWFPGLTESLDSLERIAPRIASIFERIGEAGGNLVAEGAEALAGPDWAEFLNFVENNAPQALDELGRTIGNLTKGLANLWMAFDPLNDDFSQWMLRASRDFAQWSEGLSETEGFQEFVAYVRENGPILADALGAIGNAILQIGEAAAPLGGPVLKALEGIADAIATIADSPLGTPIMAGVTAMSALSVATTAATAALGRFKIAQASLGVGGITGAAKGGAAMAAGGGPAGLAGLAILAGSAEQIGNVQDTRSGQQGGLEGILRSALPGIGIAEDWLGINWPGLSKDVDMVAGSTGRLIDQALTLGGALEDEAEAAREAATALQEQARATLSGFSATTQYREALKAANEQATTNNAGIKGNSDAALANRDALANLAAAWQQQRAEMGEVWEATGQLESKQRSARRAFIEVAESMGVSRRRAKELADALLGIPKKVDPKVTVETAAAKAALQSFKAQLDSIRSKNITVSTTFKNFYENVQGPKSNRGGATDPFRGPLDANPADGGTIPRFGGRPIRSDAGSTVPDDGGGYRDYLLYLLAPLEEVISNRRGQADEFRAELKDINAGMSRAEVVDRMLARGLDVGGTVEGFASGGTSGKSGKSSKNVSMLQFFPEFGMTLPVLKDFIKSLEGSKEALDKELSTRRSLAESLASAVTGKFSSDLFGDTDVWSAGGSLGDAIARLQGDIAASSAFQTDIGTLKSKGLTGAALDTLLTQADPATVANIAATASAEQLKQYSQLYAQRDTQNAATAAAAQVATGLTAQVAKLEAQLVQVNAQLAAGNKLADKAPAKTAKTQAKVSAKGAAKSALNIRRG